MSKGKRDDNDLDSSATTVPRKAATFPPSRWSDEVVTKTQPPRTLPPVDSVAPGGGTSAHPPDATAAGPISERDARGFLTARFRAAGYDIQADHSFHAPGLAVVLDGFDPKQRVGYCYISHHDADVISDIGAGEELAFKALSDLDDAHVLVIHDTDVPDQAELERRLDAFLAMVHRRRS